MAAVGVRMTANNLTVGGVTYNGVVDLDNVFHALGTATAAAATGVRSAANADMSTFFYPLAAGGTALPVATGIRKGAADLNTIFAAKGTVGTGGGGGGGCLPFGTRVLLWDQGDKAIEDIAPGDVVIGYYIDGMIDEDLPDWREWSTSREEGKSGTLMPVTVVMTLHASYPSHWLVNGELRATYEHRFLTLRDGRWSWRQARELQPGDAFLSIDREEVEVTSVEFVESEMQVANIDVEEVDCFMFQAFEGVSILSHNPDDKS